MEKQAPRRNIALADYEYYEYWEFYEYYCGGGAA